MNFLITFIAFIFVLGITVLVHEFGHFIFAKKAGIYVYEFSIGMGPRIFKFTRKNDETEYSIRALPIGGYVQMAGEEIEADEKIPEEKRMQSKRWSQRLMVMIAGVMMNFLLAIFLLFILSLVNGAPSMDPVISKVSKSSPAYKVGLKKDDKILSINNHKVLNSDDLLLKLQIAGKKESTMVVKHASGNIETLIIKPKKEIVKGESVYRYGFEIESKVDRGLLVSLQYAITKFLSLFYQMLSILFYLITGSLSIKNLSGPVGIFSVVGATLKTGLSNLIYLLAYICINVGLINLLPIPAFDGGHVLFLIIEKIKGSPVNPKLENTIHTVFLVLLMILMLYITFNDILRLF